jgi:hypothetical protein
LEEVAKSWVRVAEPIQLSLKSRALDDERSQRIAYPIRNLGLELFNDHSMRDEAKRITDLLQGCSLTCRMSLHTCRVTPTPSEEF